VELRHRRCFVAVAEELHFARAAVRPHIEQSPLSRAIKELEEDLGVQLFERTLRSTRLTRAGKLFLEHVPRIFTALQQPAYAISAAHCAVLCLSGADMAKLPIAVRRVMALPKPPCANLPCRADAMSPSHGRSTSNTAAADYSAAGR
jgi:hypothetical protein